MSGETMLVQAIAETLETMKNENFMIVLPTANEAKRVANEYYKNNYILKTIGKLIQANASNGKYNCRINLNMFERGVNKPHLASSLRQGGYEVIYDGDIMEISWGK